MGCPKRVNIIVKKSLRAKSVQLLQVLSTRGSSKYMHVIPHDGPLIIDTDAGVDDGVAIVMLLHARQFSVKAITCVRGTTNVFNVAINVQKVLNSANRSDVPLYVGADFGLSHTEPTSGLYGRDGFADLDETGVQMTNLDKGHAAIAIAKMVTENPGKITILCLGPLTNLALACHLQPQLLRLAKSVFVYGGTFGVCLVSILVESNFYIDPEAAQFVFMRAHSLNRSIVVLPMDIGTELSFDKQIRKAVLGQMKGPEMTFLNKAYDRLDMMHAISNQYHKNDKMITCDFYAAALMINREAPIDVYPYYLEVDTHGVKSRSITIVDFANVTQNPPNAYIIYNSDRLTLDKTVIVYLQ